MNSLIVKKRTLNQISKKRFDEEYNKMKDSLKWKLKCTGRVVEDTIYECMSDFTSEQRSDAIIRKMSGRMRFEYEDFEVGKRYEGQSATKWLYESGLKTFKEVALGWGLN
ncbi:14686_t:CDS:2 [Dentiscutata erythropus]|uniref:14686_t:CDS:1 n=1 Tax=Dentiscutata erythropus TaxID=1348616 RepID=A0A9N9GNH3_9GLOM|nr:14686_t:CDS:2 [Dentiscutata erythropus]